MSIEQIEREMLDENSSPWLSNHSPSDSLIDLQAAEEELFGRLGYQPKQPDATKRYQGKRLFGFKKV
jgi:hypothetical protein